MLDLRDVQPHAKIVFMSGLNCSEKIHQQKVVACHNFEVIDDEPLQLVRCNRSLMPGRTLILVNDIKLFNACLYVVHDLQMYMLSIRVQTLFLKLKQPDYIDFYERVFMKTLPPTLSRFSSNFINHDTNEKKEKGIKTSSKE